MKQFVAFLLLAVATTPVDGARSIVDWSSSAPLQSGAFSIPPIGTSSSSTDRVEPSSPSHDACEAALDVQPEGPGEETVLVNQDTGNLEVPYDTLFPCDTYGWMNTKSLFYKFLGTGNPFYITTCPKEEEEEDSNENNLQLRLELTEGWNCTDTPRVCLEEQYDKNAWCPGERNGVLYSFSTTAGTEYTFAVRTDPPGNYTLRVGELPNQSTTIEHNSCWKAEEILLPAITADEESTMALWRDNEGIYNPHYERTYDTTTWTIDRYTAGRWFVFRAPERAVELKLSTCDDDDDDNSTLAASRLAYLWVQDNANASTTSPCNSLTPAAPEPTYPKKQCTRTALATKPNATYYLYASSQSPIDFGTFRLSLAIEQHPPPLYRVFEHEQERRERRRPGIKCSRPEFVYRGDETLSCRDSCRYCENDDDSPLAGLCFNRTDVTRYDKEYNSYLVSYEVHVDYFEDMNGENKTSFVYNSTEGDDACNATWKGQPCASCAKQEGGAPLVDCSNLATEEGDPWTQGTLDLCRASTTVFSTEAGVDHNVEGICEQYLWDAPCNRSAALLADAYGLTCSCSMQDMAMRLECTTECGLFCNANRTVCGTRRVLDVFNTSGELVYANREFKQVIPEESGPVRLTLNDNMFREEDHCDLELSSSTDCDTCSLKTCKGSTDPFLFGADLDCANIEGGSTYDLCDANLQVEDGPFRFLLASDSFQECLDLAPSHSVCAGAQSIELGELVSESTLFIQQAETHCDVVQLFPGLYYRVIGNGGWYIADTCSNETTAPSSILVIEGGDDPNEACGTCLNLPYRKCGEFGRIVAWQTEMGKEYIVYVGTQKPSPGSADIALLIQEMNYINATELCEAERTLVDDNEYRCECNFYKDLDIHVLECFSECERCFNPGGAEEEICADVYTGRAFNHINGEYRQQQFFNITNLQEDLTLYYDIQEWDGWKCQAAIGQWPEGMTPCACNVVACDSGAKEGIIDCSAYEEGLVVDLCARDESNLSTSLLTALMVDEYGECDGLAGPAQKNTTAPLEDESSNTDTSVERMEAKDPLGKPSTPPNRNAENQNTKVLDPDPTSNQSSCLSVAMHWSTIFGLLACLGSLS